MNSEPTRNLGIHRAKIAMTCVLLIPAIGCLALFLLTSPNPDNNPHLVGIRLPLVLSALLMCVAIVATFWSRHWITKTAGGLFICFFVFLYMRLNSIQINAGESSAQILWEFIGALLGLTAIALAIIAVVAWVLRGFFPPPPKQSD